MIISTIDLNNIENKIQNPQIEGIEFLTTSYDESTKIVTLNASYNDLINMLSNNKLPILKFLDSECYYDFIHSIYHDEDLNSYECRSSSYTFTALNATTNFSFQISPQGEGEDPIK